MRPKDFCSENTTRVSEVAGRERERLEGDILKVVPLTGRDEYKRWWGLK